MPRSIACASSGAHIIGSTHATCGLTAKPPGTQRSLSTIAWYSSTHALASSGSTNEKLSAPMPFSAARRIVSRREHATHSGGWGFWTGLGTTLRGGIVRKRPSAPANGSSTIIRATTGSISSHSRALGLAVDAEALELGAARRLAGAELDAPARDEVEHRGALGHARGVLVAERQREDPEAQADALRALRGGAEEHARGARVRVLLEEVVLDLPRGVEADAVGELDLLEGVLDEPLLAVVAPRAGDLVLVEDPEAHGASA